MRCKRGRIWGGQSGTADIRGYGYSAESALDYVFKRTGLDDRRRSVEIQRNQ